MRKVLIIDDEQGIINILREEIQANFEGIKCVCESDFNQAVECIERERPDAVVLDLLEGAVTADPPGQRTWKSIWEGRFCPVIIYTAFGGELHPPVPENHPFVKLVVKGAGTEAQVIRHLASFQPLVQSIWTVHHELDLVLQRVLRDTAGAALIPGTDTTHLVHAARRRVAAFMDEKTASEGRSLFSWELYLVPAFGEDPLTGDLIRRRDASWNDPEAYRLILSASCDLVTGRNEQTVLVAKCSSPHAMTERMSLPTDQRRASERIRDRALSSGFWNGFLPLPEFPSQIPYLVANLKDLEVIQHTSIIVPDGQVAEYDRIASIDSPFREQITWAFLSTLGRPGMPERDLQSWADGILDAAGVRPEAT